MSSVYERELRAVLAGEIKGVRAIIKSCTEVERARAMQVVQRPFLVVRAPGSGSEGTGDLLALRGDMCFPIEVKSSKSPKQYFLGAPWTSTKHCALLVRDAVFCHSTPIASRESGEIVGVSCAWK